MMQGQSAGMGAPGMGAPGMGAPGMGMPGMGMPGMGMGCMGLDEWTTGPVFAVLNRHHPLEPEELKKHQRRDFLALSEQEEHETRLLEKRPAWPQQGSSHRMEAEPNV